MSFISGSFLLFFPVVTIVYFALPQKLRWFWLLIASYFFYMSWSPQYGILLAVSTVITYFSGLLIEKAGALPDAAQAAKRKKLWVAVSFVLNLGILVVFKYLNFFDEIYTDVISSMGMSAGAMKFDLLLPVGIPFYTFQALSYTVDVYRGDLRPERHFGKYALFVSFFPQLVAGPIEKSKDLLHQFSEIHRFDYDRARRGFLLMLWGYFQKMVVADRLGQLVNTVYGSPGKYSGAEVAVASIFFAFQIYCDFGGYSNIAIGAAQVLGFSLTTNFSRPYFSLSIKEFWRRWHITLGAWFRDYLYIPLGGNRCSLFKQCLNLFLVFAVCGLWHGASFTFVIWGTLHGLYQIFGLLLKPARRKAAAALNIDPDSRLNRFLRASFTFVLVDFAWIFFRAGTVQDAFTLIGSLFRPADLSGGALFRLGLTAPEFFAGILGIAVVLAVDVLSRKTDLRALLLEKRPAVRWTAYFSAVLVILILGIYGSQYTAQQFIYFQF
ncbi:alginate O-acetyltransferase [Clostridium sp. W14A]|nr:alginate O-acetyltransferase [Clostridium sp. W14A]